MTLLVAVWVLDFTELLTWRQCKFIVLTVKKLLGGRLAAQLLLEFALRADELVDGFNHVHRDADGARLVRDSARDRLAHPPRRVCRELIAPAVIELVDGLHQAEIALLDEVEDLESAVRIALGDRHHEPEVCLDELLLGRIRLRLAPLDDLQGALQLGGAGAAFLLELLEPLVELAQLFAQVPRARRAGIARLLALPLDARNLPFERPKLLHRPAHAIN